jgi:DNA-binding IclR family transcriptional regulator
MSVSGPVTRMNRRADLSKAPYLLDAAQQISLRLGYDQAVMKKPSGK